MHINRDSLWMWRNIPLYVLSINFEPSYSQFRPKVEFLLKFWFGPKFWFRLCTEILAFWPKVKFLFWSFNNKGSSKSSGVVLRGHISGNTWYYRNDIAHWCQKMWFILKFFEIDTLRHPCVRDYGTFISICGSCFFTPEREWEREWEQIIFREWIWECTFIVWILH
jgi:hypothetical protein